MEEMKPMTGGATAACGCGTDRAACGCAPASASAPGDWTPARMILGLAAAVAAWWLLYQALDPFATWLARDLMGLDPATRLGAAVHFFLYDSPKVMMLMVAAIFGAGIVRSFFTPQRTRRLLAGRRELAGNAMAAGLGVLTPFCTCSAIPLFLGFVTAGVPLGVTFSFLISAPMVNELALVLLFGLVGWKAALLYLASGLTVAITAGWILGRMRLDHLLEDWVAQVRAGEEMREAAMTWPGRVRFGIEAVKDIIGKVWHWVLLGIGLGAAIHGYVPESFMADIMGRAAWWSVPAAVAVGVPMYSGCAGIVPVVQALLEKGAAVGTVLAFMMSVVALSLPEMVILRRVLKTRLIAVFVGVVASGILLTGFLFNLVI